MSRKQWWEDKIELKTRAPLPSSAPRETQRHGNARRASRQRSAQEFHLMGGRLEFGSSVLARHAARTRKYATQLLVPDPLRRGRPARSQPRSSWRGRSRQAEEADELAGAPAPRPRPHRGPPSRLRPPRLPAPHRLGSVSGSGSGKWGLRGRNPGARRD